VYLLPAANAVSIDEKATSPSVTIPANVFIQRFMFWGFWGGQAGPRCHESKMRIMALDACPVMVHVNLATSWDDGNFDSFSGEGQIERFLIVS
jgi:hypothetical protein